GLCYYRLGSYNTALALFERIGDNRPEDYNSNYYAGLCYLALGDRVQAIRAFEKAFKKYFVDTTELCLKKLLQRVFSYTEKQSA
ncbi:MAG: tetratricopeptide repeat protein, partial [Candidatus Sumerlaeia bacterium]|nr:tetratricopeptide repeat protein [Candidatus Sumerlaeia bacterium]